MSYYRARRHKVADQYLDRREAEKRAEAAANLMRERVEKAKAWLDGYHARPRSSAFDWRPHFPLQKLPTE